MSTGHGVAVCTLVRKQHSMQTDRILPWLQILSPYCPRTDGINCTDNFDKLWTGECSIACRCVAMVILAQILLEMHPT